MIDRIRFGLRMALYALALYFMIHMINDKRYDQAALVGVIYLMVTQKDT